MRPPEALLYDSEASLRLVDHAIEELNTSGAKLDNDARGFLEHVANQPGGFAELSKTLLRAYAETVGIVQRIRESTGMGDDAGIDKLQQMHGRLHEVSTATESATTDILDAVTRTITLVDKLDDVDAETRKTMIASIKEELGGLTNHLQFQDITAQQLQHIASLLADMRRRIAQIITIFAPGTQLPAESPHIDATAFDPHATAVASPESQAVADEIFSVRKSQKKSA